MQNEKNKKLSKEELAALLSEEEKQDTPMQDELTSGLEEKPGMWKRLASKVEKRERAAKERRIANEGKAASDRTSFMLAAIPFWAVAGTTLKNGAALCVILLVTLIPASFLRDILRRRLALSEWISLPISVLVATMLASGCCAALTLVDAALYDALGIYLFLMVAAPILMNTECYGKPESGGQFWRRTFRFILDFTLVMLISSAIREMLGYNSIFGLALPFMGNIKLEAARQPFFGLIFSGFLLALIRSFEALLHKSLHRRRVAEQRSEEAHV